MQAVLDHLGFVNSLQGQRRSVADECHVPSFDDVVHDASKSGLPESGSPVQVRAVKGPLDAQLPDFRASSQFTTASPFHHVVVGHHQ